MPNLSIEELARFEAIEDAVERWLARPMHEDASNGELVHDLIACGVVLGDQRGPYPEPPEGNIFCSADDHQYDFATGEAELTAFGSPGWFPYCTACLNTLARSSREPSIRRWGAVPR